jgi:hypothetical protein
MSEEYAFLKVINRCQLSLMRDAFMRCLFILLPDRSDATPEQWKSVKALKKLLKVKQDFDLFYDFTRELSQDEMDALWRTALAMMPAHLIDAHLFSMEFKFRQSRGLHPIVFDEFELTHLYHTAIRESDCFVDEEGGRELLHYFDMFEAQDRDEDDEGGEVDDIPGMPGPEEMDRIFGIRNAPDSPVAITYEDRWKADIAIAPSADVKYGKN